MLRHKCICLSFIASMLALLLTFSGVCTALTLDPIGAYPDSPIADWFDEGSAETVDYDPVSRTIVITNRYTQSVHVVDITNPSEPTKVMEIDVSAYGREPTTLDIHNGMLAVSVPADVVTDNGVVLLTPVDSIGVMAPVVIEVGALPDAVKFTPDGRHLIVLNEGEPNNQYTVDPEGSVSIINLKSLHVRTATFKRFNRMERLLKAQGVRIFGPNATVAQDLEPENLTISEDSNTAWVTLQENNALAVVDIRHARVNRVIPLGYKAHWLAGNELDASDKDREINIQNWPVLGMYQPDGIASFRAWHRTWLVTANEGDARDYVYTVETGEVDEDGQPIEEDVVTFSEEARVKDLLLPDIYNEYWPDIQENENLGRLSITTSPPFGKVLTDEGVDMYTQIYAFGGRSFSIRDTRGQMVFDSGADFERITADLLPDFFNANNDENKAEKRSDDKGPEPEGVTVGQIDDAIYAFISLERIGGVMVYDVSTPWHPVFVTYANNRYFDGDPEDGEAGDLAPEGMAFISADDSPNGMPLLITANEVSGNVTIFQIDPMND
ncbi:MAG: choice-of-anchor I family protein [Deltaproteobacteria bacterium]|nr:choice-of-anchor I family protein [Deltaproteobacteria bacterium]